jgi:addiction module RelE/StbE family toxin
MITIVFTARFLRQYKKLEPQLQEEVKESITLFKHNPKNSSLRLHKLQGTLKDQWSFSVNYQIRIVCMYDTNDTVALLRVGDHDVYKRK